MRLLGRRKRTITFILCCILLLSTGCRKTIEQASDAAQEEKQDSNQVKTKGRYVEEKIELPQGRQERVEEKFFMKENSLHTIYLSTQHKLVCKKWMDGTWVEVQFPWMEQAGSGFLNRLSFREDGTGYMEVGSDKDGKYLTKTYQIIEDKAKEINSTSNDLFEAGWSREEYLDGGNKLVQTAQGTFIYDSTGETLFQKNIFMQFYIFDNEIALEDTGKNQIVCVGMNGNEKKTYPVDISLNGVYLGGCDKKIYLFSMTGGLYCCDAAGSLWQHLFDGGVISHQEYIIDNFYIQSGEHPVLYLSARDESDDLHLIKYYFDPEVSMREVAEERNLTIYSMIENQSIQRTIAVFRHEYPDVNVKYRFYPYINPLEDKIHALNTELLAGEGPDLILTEYLPEEKYIKKGVFEDITDLVELHKDDLNPCVLSTFQRDGRYYTIPIRITIPLIYGEEEVIQSMNSLSELSDFLKRSDRQDLFDIQSVYVPYTFLRMFYDEIVDEKTGKLNESSFKQYALIVKDVMKRCEPNDENVFFNIASYTSISLMNGFGAFTGDREDHKTRIVQYGNNEDFGMIIDAKKIAGFKIQTYRNRFVPEFIMGINKASKNKEAARNFINLALSEQFQDTYGLDGFSVNSKLMEKHFIHDKTKEKILYWKGGDVKFPYINEGILQGSVGLLQNLKERVVCDESVCQMIEDQIQRYLQGEIELDAMVEETAHKMNMMAQE